jgi:putative transposase
MARKRFTPEQIVAILRDVERSPSRSEALRKHGVSDQTFYRWRRMYGGMETSQIKRIKELEDENKRLKHVVGEQALVIDTMKEFSKKKGWA